MDKIDKEKVQNKLNELVNKDLYLHLETTNGVYAAAQAPEKTIAVGAYIRNGLIRFNRAVISGNGPFRVGLKMENGWVYAEGLTDWEVDYLGRLLLAGHDEEGRLAVALQLSSTPF